MEELRLSCLPARRLTQVMRNEKQSFLMLRPWHRPESLALNLSGTISACFLSNFAGLWLFEVFPCVEDGKIQVFQRRFLL